ncbi:Uncharacterised protein [Yersinia intermedia]|uniref:hypothetical protein n=1 Tax=Yersinia intermedia TaxID=631 RepID=UPI0005E39EF1|nr:hypothetical protein [Yersinia intermedia]HDX8417260.1 hypothetical protein [Yersinia enterocolitica]CNB69926.1 Uncharacterised protein [Yersinia intermedia]CNC20268.1 Uncharacterised protein [Yersinia intermedia]CNH19216.1 Uncharacterised protein [Yersinia intermedia]CRE87086.1 Uncharacterised protein [Yersinia intermedia]
MLSFEIGFILNITETECAGTERPVRLAIYPLALMEQDFGVGSNVSIWPTLFITRPI